LQNCDESGCDVYPGFVSAHEPKGWTRVPEFLPASQLEKAIENMPWLRYRHKKGEEVPDGRTK
jgi:hypothetical protein